MTENSPQDPLVIPAREMSVGGPMVRRYLPYAKKRMVGPFIFFDHFPSTHFEANQSLDVRPHPHIGLSTLSYLLEGEVLHHDSLGCKQVLKPGDVNWMTAGKGIAHSERLPESLRNREYHLHLLQFWVALPLEFEDVAPSFIHYPQQDIPHFKHNNNEIRLIAGEAFEHRSPVRTYSPLVFMDVQLSKNNRFEFSAPQMELAFFVLQGAVDYRGQSYPQGSFVVAGESHLVFDGEGQVIVLGGEAFKEPRHIFWNFVSSSKEKIELAKSEWRNRTFPQVPGEDDIIPLPE